MAPLGGCIDVWSGLALILSRWSLIGLEVVLAGSYDPCCQQPRPRPPRIQDVPDARSPTVSRTTKGAVGIGCSRSHGSRRPSVCGKSPTEIAFAVHLWAPGNRTPPTTTQQETRPRSGPPSSWANQSPKMTTTAPFGAGHQGEPTSRWTCTEDTGRSPGPSGSGKTSAAQRRQAAGSRQAARRQRLNGEGPAGGPALLRSSAKGNLWFSLAEWEGLCSRLGTPLSWRRGTWSGSEWVR